MSKTFTVGLDYGTEAVRAVLANVANGAIVAQATKKYRHGVIDEVLPTGGPKLPPDYALQHPLDWLTSASSTVKAALKMGKVRADQVVGIGVDFTSCTMLPTRADGTPLCLIRQFEKVPLAWPKLWKHHGAKAETDRINQIARQRSEPWLARFGGTIGLEWFFPKILEALNHAPKIYDAAEVWLEAGDWLVWQLTSGPFPDCDASKLARSTCQAGYKAMWTGDAGYPSPDFFAALHPKLRDVVKEKMPGVMVSPGARAGKLTPAAAKLLGLAAGTPISASVIDAHAGVPGAGVAGESTLVMVMGTSSCHMLNSSVEKLIPGVAGVVDGGILPGYFGYETGQSSVGDAFAWLVETFKLSHQTLTREAESLPPGADGVLAIDWLNGCRTPLMDGRLSGAFLGLTLGTTPAQMYRALLEATAMGVRWIVEDLRAGGVPVKRFVASGGLPAKSPLLMQIYADVLGEPIALAESDQSVALGAAILGALAAGQATTGHASAIKAINAMARQRRDLVYKPDRKRQKQYDVLYQIYRAVTAGNGVVTDVMRRLRTLG